MTWDDNSCSPWQFVGVLLGVVLVLTIAWLTSGLVLR